MSSLETPPDDDRERDPNDTSGGPAGTKSSNPPSGSTATSQQPVKARPKLLREEICDILLAKARKAANVLKPLNLPEATLAKAAETAATRRTNVIMAAACKYARKSAHASKFKAGDVLDEVLVPLGIAPSKPRRTKSANKNAEERKKGGNHGNKS